MKAKVRLGTGAQAISVTTAKLNASVGAFGSVQTISVDRNVNKDVTKTDTDGAPNATGDSETTEGHKRL